MNKFVIRTSGEKYTLGVVYASFSFITSPALCSFTASKLGETPLTARARPLVRRISRHRLARHDLEWLQLTSFRRIIVSWEFPQKCCKQPLSRIAIERKLLRDLDTQPVVDVFKLDSNLYKIPTVFYLLLVLNNIISSLSRINILLFLLVTCNF